MILPDFDYVRPSSLDEACTRLNESSQEAIVLAGGHSLLTDLLGEFSINRACRADSRLNGARARSTPRPE